MVVPTPGAAFPNAPAYLPVLLDGQLVGFVALPRVPRLVQVRPNPSGHVHACGETMTPCVRVRAKVRVRVRAWSWG